MIVDENKVAIALEYLGTDPAPIALARKDLTKAENKCKRIYSKAYLAAKGTIDERKAHAELDGEYQAAQDEYAEIVGQLENARAMRESGKMLIETWMEESRNIRAAERIR